MSLTDGGGGLGSVAPTENATSQSAPQPPAPVAKPVVPEPPVPFAGSPGANATPAPQPSGPDAPGSQPSPMIRTTPYSKTVPEGYEEISPEQGRDVLDAAYAHHGMKYPGNENGHGKDTIDCSDLTTAAYDHAGIHYGDQSSENIPSIGNVHFVEVDTPRDGDIV